MGVFAASVGLLMLTAILLPASPNRTDFDDLRGIVIIGGFLLLAAWRIALYVFGLQSYVLEVKNAGESKHRKLWFALKLLFIALLIASIIWLLVLAK
jgi:membrane protein CcdC involved in cytochrome C biogenesis